MGYSSSQFGTGCYTENDLQNLKIEIIFSKLKKLFRSNRKYLQVYYYFSVAPNTEKYGKHFSENILR